MRMIQKIIGYILLLPAFISVLLFVLQIFTGIDPLKSFASTSWTGDYGFYSYQYREHQEGGGGGGYTSALPIYFGLMAIAGAYLIKNKD